MKKSIIITLSVTLLISVALNVRLYIMSVQDKDTWLISLSESTHIEDEALYNLEKNRIEKAKEILSKSVGEKALFLGLCIENKCISNEAITTITKTHNKALNRTLNP